MNLALLGDELLAEHKGYVVTTDNDGHVNEQYLREIEQRLEAATPGPWCHRDQFIESSADHGQLLGVTMQRNEQGLTQLPGNENARFIAHAPTDVRNLIDEVRRLRAAAWELEQRCARDTLTRE